MRDFIRIDSPNIPWLEMYMDYCITNTPLVLSAAYSASWSARKDWVLADGSPNTEYLDREYGSEIVPVVSSSVCEPEEISLRDYIAYSEQPSTSSETSLYLKDWHFQARCGSHMYCPPPFLASDWVNSEKWTGCPENPFRGDYKFLYYGVKGTWTKLHSDVLSSHSWSANICGRKLWYFVPIGSEHIFKSGTDHIEDLRDCKHLWAEAGVFTVEQGPGEIMFVPSNWYHQVHNLETAISLNHNSINATNIHHVFSFLNRRMGDVNKEIEHLCDVFTETEMKEKIQLILGADARLNMPRLRDLLHLVIEDRSSNSTVDTCYVCPRHSDLRDCATNPLCRSSFTATCSCISTTCPKCTGILRSFDLSIAIDVLHRLDSLDL